jgi:hypothetical protein
MTTEFDDSEHWGFFLTGQKLTSETGKYVRMSSLVLAALRSAGVFSTMEDGTTAPATDKLWLDKNTDPPTLKEWDATGASWVPMTYGRLFGQAAVGFLTVTGGTGNAVVISAPAGFQANRLYLITPTATNTGAATIQVAGVGTYNVKYGNGSDLEAGEFTTGRQTALFFDGSKFVVILAVGASGVPDGSITRPKLAPAVTAELDGKAGLATANTFSQPMTLNMAASQMFIMKPTTSAILAYLRWQDETGSPIGYLGLDNRTGNNLTFRRNGSGNIDIHAGGSSGTLTFTGAATFNQSASISGDLSVSGGASGGFLRGYISGLTLSNNTTDATNDLDIASGSAGSDGTMPVLMTLASSITKRLDAAWAVGSGSGGRDTGAVADGWWYVWLIRRSDTGVVDALFSASATSPTMPTNYDQKRLIFAFERSGGVIRPFTHRGGNDVSWVTPVENFNSTSVSTAGALVTVTAPPLTGARAILRTTLSHGAAAAAWFRETTQTNEAVSISTADASTLGSGGRSHTVKSLAVSASSQIRYRCDLSSVGALIIATEGFVFPRGGA